MIVYIEQKLIKKCVPRTKVYKNCKKKMELKKEEICSFIET